MALTALPTAPTSSSNVIHPSLPQRPSYNFAANADSIGLGAAPTPQSIQNAPTAAQALGGSNRDVVANRRAIRMANMSAAEVLKAQLNSLSPVKPSAKTSPVPASKPEPVDESNIDDDMDSVPGLGAFSRQRDLSPSLPPPPVPQLPRSQTPAESDADADGELDPDTKISTDSEAVAGNVLDILAGAKRKFEEGPGSDEPAEDVVIIEEDDDDTSPLLTLKVNSDGTAEQEDHVKLVWHLHTLYIFTKNSFRLWEPGYKERYYRQKFGVELIDTAFRKKWVSLFSSRTSGTERCYLSA